MALFLNGMNRSLVWILFCSGKFYLWVIVCSRILLFCQLAPTGNENQTVGGFPVVQWAQTANYSYVPNDRLQNVFMAVAIDLGDPTSPFGSVHPCDKRDIGSRLA